MLERMAGRITKLMVSRGIIEENQRDNNTYGIILKATRSAITLSILLISIVVGVFPETLCYCLAFLFIKNHTPGYDCPKYIQCYSLSVSVYLSFVVAYHFTPIGNRAIITPIWAICCAIVIASKYAFQVYHGNHIKMIIISERKSLLLFSLFCGLSVVFSLLDITMVSYPVAYAAFGSSITYTPMEVEV